MDISKILDFHRMVMMSMDDKPSEDETVCGPLCQHPACWDSNRRRERGVPRLNTLSSSDSDSDSDLPTVKYYNMLEDYGDSPKDRFPARFGGRALHEHSSSMRNVSDPLATPSIALTTAPFASPVSPVKAQHPLMPQPMRLVEVQEVFDKADLNSQWDETFMTRQYLVWVPNPKKRKKKKSEVTPRPHEETKTPRSLLPKDLTELMVPLEIKQQREESVLFDEWPVLKKKQARSQSPLFRHGTYPRTPNTAIKPDVDAEGYDFYEIGERILSSDFVSREKIHGIIEEVLSTTRDRGNVTGRDASPRRSAIDTSDVLRQQKLQLHHSTQRHLRSSCTMSQQPVFQLDNDEKRSVDSARGGTVSDIESTQRKYLKELPQFRKPLPGISVANQVTPRHETVPTGKVRRKIPSVSLGLPELPSGLRQTRAFTYNNRHRPDFTLVPVPTPPTSVRSSGSLTSDHGTTMRVNLPSVSDLEENDYYDREPIGLLSTDRTTREDGALHLVSPALSTNVPLAPASTPATFHSPTKSLMYRDLTNTSSMQAGDGVRSMPPSRDITMSPGHKISIPTTGPLRPGTSGSAEDQGLDTIRETAREHGATSSMRSSAPGQTVQFAEPAPQLSSPSNGHLTLKVGDQSAAKGEGNRTQPTQQGKDISTDYWPQVTESNYDLASGRVGSCSDVNFMMEQSMLADHGTLQRGRSDLSSRGSNRSSLARRIMDENAKQVVESPAPPPPSPEPKEQLENKLGRNNKRESKSRESASMKPLLEQSESEGSSSPRKSLEKKSAESKSLPIEPIIKKDPTPSAQLNLDLAATSNNFDPVSKVMVSHVAPRPSGSRDKLQQTFINVDIPAEEVSGLHAEQGFSGAPDLTSSKAASPEKMSPFKGSPGSASPVKKSAGKPAPKKTGIGEKRGDRKNGKDKKSPAQSPEAEKSEHEQP